MANDWEFVKFAKIFSFQNFVLYGNCCKNITLLVAYKMYPNQKHSRCKKSHGQDLKKAVGLCRNAVDHIKHFDNNDPGLKTFFLPQCFAAQEKCFAAWVTIIKFLM